MLCPYCKKVIAKEIPESRLPKITYEEYIEKRLRRGHIAKIPEKQHVYECPRCRGRFVTKEFIYKTKPNYKLNIQGIKQYEGNRPSKQEVSNDIQDLIIKVFGQDIKKDIAKDLKELKKGDWIVESDNIISL